MVTIKTLKIGGLVHDHFTYKYEDENGVEVTTLTEDLDEFKVLASDTVKWKAGSTVKKNAGSARDLTVVNAKAIVLLAKLLNTIADVDVLSDKEKVAFNSMLTLADNGYADSDSLVSTTAKVNTEVGKVGDNLKAITGSESIDEVIAILNSL